MIKWNVSGLRQHNRSSGQAGLSSLPTVARRQKLSVKCEVESKQSTVGAKIHQLPVHFQRAKPTILAKKYWDDFQTST